MSRAVIPLAAVLAATVGLAGCGGGGSSSSSSPSGSGDGGPIGAGETLVLMGFGKGDEIAQARAALAKKAVAPAKVQNPEGAFADQAFLTRVASKNVPDLIYLDRQKVGTYAAKGALMPVDDCGIDMSQYRKPAVAEVTFEGKPYGVPEFYSNRTLIVNQRLTKKAGIKELSTTDWDTLKADAKKLAVVSGGKVKRIGFDPKLPEFFPLWAKANGVDLISADGKTPHLDDPKTIEALRFAASLIDEQGGWNAFKAFRDTWDFFGADNEYAKDQVGAFPMEDWYYNVLSENSPDIQIVGKPMTDRQGDPINLESGSAWAIPRGAKHVELACKWAKTMTAPASWVAAAKARIKDNAGKVQFTGLYTGNSKADEQIFSTLYKSKGTQFDKAVTAVRSVQDSAFALPASPAGAAVNQAWTDAVNRVLTSGADPAAALHRAQREAEDAIANAEHAG
jgi:multiple sugar transport system substrate-binding protein